MSNPSSLLQLQDAQIQSRPSPSQTLSIVDYHQRRSSRNNEHYRRSDGVVLVGLAGQKLQICAPLEEEEEEEESTYESKCQHHRRKHQADIEWSRLICTVSSRVNAMERIEHVVDYNKRG
jgi:hypothetical protein